MPKSKKKGPEGRTGTRRGGRATRIESRSPERKDERSSGCDSIASENELIDVLRTHFGSEVKTEFETGPNHGVMLTLPIRGTSWWVTSEFLPPNDERDHFEAVGPFIPFRLACAILMTTPKTLYSRVQFMASSIKIFGRWHFKKRLFYEVDLAEETELPTRQEILAEREGRRTAGEVLRGGRHAAYCARDHEGRCKSHRPSLSASEHARNRRRILEDLGK